MSICSFCKSASDKLLIELEQTWNVELYNGPVELYNGPVELYNGPVELYNGPVELFLIVVIQYSCR